MVWLEELGAAADALAARLNNCGPSRADPARWFEEKSEISRDLRRLARRIRGR